MDYSNTKTSEERLQDMILQIAWRANAFGDFYPFSLKGNTFSCEEDLSDKHKTYLVLLLCANLPFINKDYKELTDTFENISYIALRNIWPKSGQVTTFGKNLTTYVGQKPERLNKLFKDIGNTSNLDTNSFRPSDSGDGGIDLAAWVELDKFQNTHILTALAQCACSRGDWSKKQSEIKHDKFSSYTQITARWNEILFTPICFRSNTGTWAVPTMVETGLLFDRLRIINQLKNDFNFSELKLGDLFTQLLLEKRDLTT